MACYTGMFSTKKFMFCIGLRAGSLIIAWLTFLYSFCLNFFLYYYINEDPKLRRDWYIVMYILFCGILIALKGLCCMPLPDKQYSRKSIQARGLRDLIAYNAIIAIICVFTFMLICQDTSNRKILSLNWNDVSVIGIFTIILTGLHLHYVAVVFSYHKNITRMEDTQT